MSLVACSGTVQWTQLQCRVLPTVNSDWFLLPLIQDIDVVVLVAVLWIT